MCDNIGGGGTISEEGKVKQIFELLGKLEEQNKEQFDRIALDLKINHHVIIDAMIISLMIQFLCLSNPS